MQLPPVGRPSLFRGPPAYEPRTPWSPGLALLATVVIVGASILGASLLILRNADLMAPSGAGPSTWRQDVSGLGTLAVWQGVAIVLTLLASVMFGGRLRDVLALRSPGPPSIYLKAVLALAALQVAVSVAQAFLVQDIYADMRPFVRLFGEQWLLALLVVGVGAPLSEELLFRGFLLSALARSRLGFAGGAALSTGLWTALHAGYSPAGMVEVFLIGVFFSWLLWRTGSLLVPIFCHALYNSLIVLILRQVPLPS
ncbi:MAG TPA: CPBP family intramembrane glutamic endopeptidase [Hyphomicrobiaceae bacterium]|nr:CPBP family intramembrane glutamic endopeptidase [Hyphomicrobiaceae bacterium]